MFRNTISAAFLSLLVLGSTTHGFTPSRSTSTSISTNTQLDMGFGDAFKGAFSNDDSIGAVKSAGLSGGPKFNESVSMNGKKVPGVVQGQKLTLVGSKARVKIPVNCNQGDCGTCFVKMNGRKVKACQTKVPNGKCNIQTL